MFSIISHMFRHLHAAGIETITAGCSDKLLAAPGLKARGKEMLSTLSIAGDQLSAPLGTDAAIW